MKKPSPAAIRDAVPLSRKLPVLEDHDFRCQVCGQPADTLQAWREHDERDRPLLGLTAVVLLGIGRDHTECRHELDAHPRLYAEETGQPGHFPLLCGPCDRRQGRTCTHPSTKANGGPGLLVQLSDPLRGAIVCNAGGRVYVTKRAMECAGRSVSGAARPSP